MSVNLNFFSTFGIGKGICKERLNGLLRLSLC